MNRGTKCMLGAACVALALVAGNAGAQDKGAATQQNSGFLSDYSKLAPSPDNPNAKRWIDKSFDFKPYQNIQLSPVEVWVSPTSQYKGASPDLLKRMGDDFTNSFKKALQPGYALVDKPGPGVLSIRIAITGINLTKPAMNPTDVLPVIFVLKTASGARSEMNVVLTGEMQALGPDGKVVAAGVVSGTSDQKIKDKQEITWKELQSVTDDWAKRLRKALDEARGIAAK